MGGIVGLVKGLFFLAVTVAAGLIIAHFLLHQGQRVGGPVGGIAGRLDAALNG